MPGTFEFHVKPTSGGAPDLVDNATYDFTIIAIKQAEGGNAKYDKSLPRAELDLRLDIVDSTGANVVVKDWVTVYEAPTPRTKLYQLISALMFNGEKPPEKGGVSASQLLGRRGRLLWGRKEVSDAKGVTAYLPIR